MPTGDVFDRLVGWDVTTPDEVRELADNSVGWTPKQIRRAHAFADAWEAAEAGPTQEVLRRTSAEIARQKKEIADGVADCQRRITQIEHEVSTGRKSITDGERETAEIARQHQQYLDMRQSLEIARQSWEEDSDLSPVEFMAARRKRLPVWQNAAKKRLTVAYLQGDEDSPFRSRS
jgi:hypothetical protein